MSKFARNLSILIVLVMFGGALAACGTPTEAPVETEAPVVEVPTEEPTEEPTEAPTEAPKKDIPLVVAYSEFQGKFSPYFGESAYDMDVAGLTQLSMMTTDRVGGIVFNAIEGETRNYNGTDYLYTGPADLNVEKDPATDTTKYTVKLREDLKFSDGEPVTADDIIFTYYTYLDPTYSGPTTLASYKILGVNDYQTQTTSEVFEKYAQLFEDIYAAGQDYETVETDPWTAEQQAYVWDELKAAGMAEAQGIVSYVDANYRDAYAESNLGKTPEVVAADPGLQVALGMIMWGFGSVDDDGVLTGPSGATFDLVETFPTVDDYYNEIMFAYENDYRAAFPYESTSENDVTANVKTAFIGLFGPLDESMGEGGVPNIAGIKKIDEYTVEVTTIGYESPAVYSILGISITPLHYYGDVAKYDYENNKFGFDFGDLSKQEGLTPTPMGAGAYKFVRYENKVVYFEANPFYYKGEPKIKEVQFKETVSAEVPSSLATGAADAGEMSYNKTRYEEVMSYNGNGEMTGPVITSSLVDNLGYGYIGANAALVNVDGVADSEASKDLRRALMTVLSVYRDVAIDSYYGEAAAVINYPISNTSWAAPQPTDEGYQVAYSVDVDGNPIYTTEMSYEERYAAAEQAALGFLEAAGYTVVDGKVTAAPEGARLSYEIVVTGDGTGDHPAFAIMTGAQASLANIGIEFKIKDVSDFTILTEGNTAGTNDFFALAWGSTIDPDMYQVYHSSQTPENGGSSNHYRITDPELDQLILDARDSDDQPYRKAIYKQALDRIIDWAVELPTYQRKNVIVFSTERINLDTLTPDITTFWGWMNDIQLLEMK